MWEVYKILFLLIIIFFTFSLFFLIVFLFNFNLFWIFFHSFFSLVFILFIIFFFKNKHSNSKWEIRLFRSDNFFYFFICEVLCEIIFVLSYFLKIPSLFNFIIIIKLGGIPFFYNFYFLSSLSFSFFITRYIFLSYGFMSKIWVFLLFSIIPTSLDIIWFYVAISCFIIIFFINFKEDNLVIWSILYNDLIYLLVLTIFSGEIIFLYMFYSVYFQWKILPIITTQQEVDGGEKYLALFNGSPVFIFNWVKFIIIFISLVIFGAFKMVLLSFISFIILFYSILRINKEFYKVFLFNKLLLIFVVVLIILFVIMTFFSNFINNFFLF